MQMIQQALLGLGLACAAATSTLAQEATAVATPNAVLLTATGPYEDLVHYILAKNDERVAKSLAAADAAAGEVVKILRAAQAREFESLRRAMHKAMEDKDGGTAAHASLSIFRILVDHLDASSLVVPKEVELLDYAGYALSLLATSPTPDSQAIARLVEDSRAWWQAIAGSVSDKHLRATVASAITGIEQAAGQKNTAMLGFGAQMLLDLVDMLEDGFKPAKARPAAK